MKSAALLKSFVAVALIYLVILLGREDVAWFMKPLLLLFLIASVAASAQFKTKSLLLSALVFSWLGDVVLMFADQGELYFIIGLLLFLTAHVLYIVLFSRQYKTKSATPGSRFYIALALIIGYLMAMLYVLYPTLGGLKIPVTVYAIVISAMLLMAVRGLFLSQNPGNYYIFFGAVCFVTSDSLLAFDKFHAAIPLASFNIMWTYLAAQFLIVFGLLALNKNESHEFTN